MLYLIYVNTCWSYKSYLRQFGSRFIRTALFLYSFKGPFNTFLIHFTFVKSVAINKDLSQPLS